MGKNIDYTYFRLYSTYYKELKNYNMSEEKTTMGSDKVISFEEIAKEKGFNVIVACRNTGKVEQIKSYGIKCHPLKWERGFSSVLDIIKDVKEVNGVIKNIRPDILHLVSIRAIVVGLLASIFISCMNKGVYFFINPTVIHPNDTGIPFLF